MALGSTAAAGARAAVLWVATLLAVLALLQPAAAAGNNVGAFKTCINAYVKAHPKTRLTLAFQDGGGLYSSLASRIFNTRFTWQKPAVVALPTSTADVVALVKCGNRAPLRYVARCGGHSYEGLSSINNGLVIDVQKINGITVSRNKKLATVGAGNRLGVTYRALYEKARAMIPGGTCIAVGISGLTAGGGIGASTRKLGLTIDWLDSFTIVTPKSGTPQTVTAVNNPELFFAVRGGTGNYGIVTSWTFRLAPVPAKITVLEVSWPENRFKDVMGAISKWKAWSLPEDYAKVEWFYGFGSLSLSIYYWGPKTGTDKILNTGPFALGGYSTSFYEELSYPDFVLHYTNFYGEKDWTFPKVFNADTIVQRQWGPNPVQAAAANAFKGGSILLDLDPSADAIAQLEKTKSANGNGWLQGRAMRGAVNNNKKTKAPTATAFYFRNIAWEIQVYTSVFGDNEVKWIRDAKKDMRPYSNGGEYVNYMDCGGTTTPWQTYFGGNAGRLQAIKKKYDPANRLDTLRCH